MQIIDTVHEQVARLASMMEIATVEYSIYCSKLIFDAMIDIVEPLPEPDEDVKAFVAEYEHLISQMAPFVDPPFPQEDDEVDEVEVEPLPVPCVDLKSWVAHIENLNIIVCLIMCFQQLHQTK